MVPPLRRHRVDDSGPVIPCARLLRPSQGQVDRTMHRTLPTCIALIALALTLVASASEAQESDRLVSVWDGVYTGAQAEDRKSTRLNSSHSQMSYSVFCLKK